LINGLELHLLKTANNKYFKDKSMTLVTKLAAFLFGCTILFYVHGSNAKTNVIAQKVKDKNKVFVQILNAKSSPEDLLKFMHDSVDEDAVIKMTVNDPEQKVPQMTFQLSKADYINSYLYGPRQIKNYHADLKTTNVEYDHLSHTIKAKETLIESGITQDPHNHRNTGRNFTSQTICDVEHGINKADGITLKSSECETHIFYEEDI